MKLTNVGCDVLSSIAVGAAEGATMGTNDSLAMGAGDWFTEGSEVETEEDESDTV